MGPEKDISKPQGRKKSPRRLLRGLFLVILAISVAVTLSLNLLLNTYVKKEIIASVNRSSKGLYHVEIGSVHARFWSGAVHMKDVRLFQDSILLEKLRKADTAAHLSRIDVNFDAVDISSIKWRNYIKSNNLQVGKIDLQSPRFSMRSKTLHTNVQNSDKDFLDLLPGLIASFAGSLRIRELNVLSGKLLFDLQYENGITRQTADEINISLNEIEIDTVSKQKAVYSQDATVEFSHYVLTTPHQDFSFTIEKGFGKASDSLLSLTGMHFLKHKESLNKEEVMDIAIGDIKASGLLFSRLIKANKIDLRKLEFDKPTINISTPYDPKKKDKEVRHLPDLVPSFARKFMDSLTIDTLLIKGGKIRTDIEEASGHITQSAEDIEIEFIRINQGAHFAEDKNHKGENVRVHLRNYELNAGGLNFNLKAGRAMLSSHTNEMLLENMMMTQMHSHGPKQKFYFINHLKKVHGTGISFPALVQNQKVVMDRLDIYNMDLKIFLDAAKPGTYHDKHMMPQDLMSKIHFDIDVSSVRLINANVVYADQEPGLKQAVLSFTRSNVELKNFTNDRNRASPAVIKGTTLIMGQGLVDFTLIIPLLSKKFDCHYYGSIGKMDGSLFNDFMIMAGLKVERGQIEPSNFDVNVSGGNADGNLEFIYHDLNIKVIEHNKQDIKKSWFANFAIKNDNPNKHGRDPEKVNIQTAVAKDDSFLYFLWKVLRIGAVETMTKSHLYKQEIN